MTTEDKSGGAAFPRTKAGDQAVGVYDEGAEGMTLRQWYAGQFLNGFMASTSTMRNPPEAARIADHAFRFADAMIEAGKK